VITVRLAETGGANVRLEVLDSGPGIQPNVLPRIFDAFTTTKAPGEGNGLGLWVSSAIVEQHQGSLRATNRPEGGAAFVVELPAVT
jgi:C4-dicarboxylate-specific signal transduction histidine kinase